LKPQLKKQWQIPSEQNADFVCAMEDVLDVYELAYDPKRPVIGFDEKPCQLIADVLTPIYPKVAKVGQVGNVTKIDSEYERLGSANLFGWVEPLTGKRDVWVTDTRTAIDYAYSLKRISEVFPDADKILIVQDNLNTHTKASLYKAFDPPVARDLAKRFEFHYTPKHGSWLNVQELEWSALQRQALSQRIGDKERLKRMIVAWLEDRIKRSVTIDWQFTTLDARIKLKRLYPVIIDC